jgi:urease accessory protein UreF
VVRRYLQAVEEGRAQAWHTLVYGLTLAIYSLPLRQGLLNYARQTLRGFIQAAAKPLQFSAADCRVILEDVSADLAFQLEAMLAREELPGLQRI